jgi:hypothetical protein
VDALVVMAGTGRRRRGPPVLLRAGYGEDPASGVPAGALAADISDAHRAKLLQLIRDCYERAASELTMRAELTSRITPEPWRS